MKKTLITIAIVLFLVVILPQLITYDQLFILGLASILGLLVYFMVCDYYKRKHEKITETVNITLTERESKLLTPVELTPIELPEDYCRKWNTHERDFVQLTRYGVPINNSIYRTGMFGGKFKDGYTLLLKYTEALYNDSITRDEARKRHLEGIWCIVDKNGVEKVNFKKFENAYLSGGVIYSVDRNYYNIETGELIGSSSQTMASDDYIFLEDHFNKDTSKRGVIQIKKSDGSWQIYPSTR